MPSLTSTDRTKPALALSGGGFRATLFHAGSLFRLNELGLLAQIERFSSVSGGSITAGVLAYTWPKLRFTDGRTTQFREFVLDPLKEFCGRNVDKFAIFKGSALPGKRISDVLADIYDDLFSGIKLEDLVDQPQFVFNATNLQTGRLFRFSKRRLADYRIGEIPFPKGIRLATAVAASSAFPPVLSPLELELESAEWRFVEGADLFNDPAYHSTLYLTDGGAYDNLALETVDNFQTLLVSDAGAPFATERNAGLWWHQQTLRALDIATDQARALRKRYLFANCTGAGRMCAYWGIDSNIDDYGLGDALRCDARKVTELASIRTRLDAFSEKEQDQLINWGYAVCDAAIRRYVPKLTRLYTPTWPQPRHQLS
jgi:NTE family protein